MYSKQDLQLATTFKGTHWLGIQETLADYEREDDLTDDPEDLTHTVLERIVGTLQISPRADITDEVECLRDLARSGQLKKL